MLSTLLTSKAYLNLGSTSLIGISKNNLSSVLLSYFFRKEQSYAIMRAAGSARIIHEKLLCAMGKPFRRKATSGILNGKAAKISESAKHTTDTKKFYASVFL